MLSLNLNVSFVAGAVRRSTWKIAFNIRLDEPDEDDAVEMDLVFLTGDVR